MKNDLRSDEADQCASDRYYGLDALRAVAMALGIVLHASLPYFNTYEMFPSADGKSLPIWLFLGLRLILSKCEVLAGSESQLF